MSQPELTVIVAAARQMGIGINGTMPWKGLRKEMQYFARVTTRSPTTNAVIMGRKTWDSIPPRFRPLKDRLNIVITRSAPAPSLPPSSTTPADAVRVPSLQDALLYARAASVSRIFVMGGAQIYDAALRLPDARRVLLTRLEAEYECDTFFPLDLSSESESTAADGSRWVRRSTNQLAAWTGEDVSDEGQEEAGVRYRFEMWERE